MDNSDEILATGVYPEKRTFFLINRAQIDFS
jgi:hypothetical protein